MKASIPEILEALRQGEAIVLSDDNDRENEGDIVVAAEKISPELVAFMQNHGKGLICLSLSQTYIDRLQLPLQVSENRAVFGTNFTVSIDHRDFIERGVTAEGRAYAIQRAVADDASAEEFSRPGYVFPLAAVPGGVFKRRGQTEGSVDLARLAGLKAGAVICEIMDEKGLMLCDEELDDFCEQHRLKMTSIEEVRQYRLKNEALLRRVEESTIDAGEVQALLGREVDNWPKQVRVLVYHDDTSEQEQLAFVVGELDESPLVRIHSECLTGDIFGSARCDCGQQLSSAFAEMQSAGSGVLIYLGQEGRGIGLGNKLRAYELQDQGRDTVDANVELGFEADLRDYRAAARILDDLKLSSVRLITNNPRKIQQLEEFGISVSERVYLPQIVDEANRKYLETKRTRLGHLIPPSDTQE